MYSHVMSIAEVEHMSTAVRAALRSIVDELPSTARACAFNLVYDADLESDVAIVVIILTYDEWDAATSEASAQASDLAWSALSPLGVIADVICRTQAEHDAVRDSEQWVTLDDDC